MKFRLTYEGRLQGNGTAKHKHEIRKAFHPQLKRLWEVEPNLSAWKLGDPDIWKDDKWTLRAGSAVRAAANPAWQDLAEQYSRTNFRFVPLARTSAGLSVGLDVLFLRPEPPGGIIKSADIDNRLKTLFDALRMPTNADELGGYTADLGEDPFFVLVEDDRILSHVSVETDTLLEPTPAANKQFLTNDARLVITVTIRPYKVHMDNLHFV